VQAKIQRLEELQKTLQSGQLGLDTTIGGLQSQIAALSVSKGEPVA
jgi:exonuclease VII small subunit